VAPLDLVRELARLDRDLARAGQRLVLGYLGRQVG